MNEHCFLDLAVVFVFLFNQAACERAEPWRASASAAAAPAPAAGLPRPAPLPVARGRAAAAAAAAAAPPWDAEDMARAAHIRGTQVSKQASLMSHAMMCHPCTNARMYPCTMICMPLDQVGARHCLKDMQGSHGGRTLLG